MAVKSIIYLPDKESIIIKTKRGDRQIFQTNKHHYEYKYKQWILIIGYRRSYNTPSRTDK